jgi:Sec-independent protein translocase protein TatA
VLGPDKLPGAARQAGRWLGELRRLSSGFQAELRDALQEPVDQTPRSTTTAVPPPKDEPEPDPGPG